VPPGETYACQGTAAAGAVRSEWGRGMKQAQTSCVLIAGGAWALAGRGRSIVGAAPSGSVTGCFVAPRGDDPRSSCRRAKAFKVNKNPVATNVAYIRLSETDSDGLAERLGEEFMKGH
jgi:hypothetical protein